MSVTGKFTLAGDSYLVLYVMVTLKSDLPIGNLQLYHSFHRLTLNQ